LLQLASEYLQEFHDSLTTSILHTWHGKSLQSHLEAKQENTFLIFQEWFPFSNKNWRRDLKKGEKAKNCANIYTDINYYGKLKEPT
jgi:hypothetical protein